MTAVAGVTQGGLLARLCEIVGAAHVLTGEQLAGHADPYSFLEDAVPTAAAVQPASVEEVRAVVRLASETRIPLWTVSRGRNYGYGGAAPRVAGSVVLDLQRMNRVLEVDEELGYVVVEPGVSFLDLHAHLATLGSHLLMSVSDIGWGSIIGNALERGFGYAAHGEHSAYICGLEVCLPTAASSPPEWAPSRAAPPGRSTTARSVPRWTGCSCSPTSVSSPRWALWLRPRPETVVVCHAKTADDADLGPLVEALRPLLLDGTIQSPAIVGNAPVVASMTTDRAAWHTGAGPLPRAAVAAMVSRLGLGWWNARFATYGAESMTRARLDVVRAALGGVPRLASTPPRTPATPTRARCTRPTSPSSGFRALPWCGWRPGVAASLPTQTSPSCAPTGRAMCCDSVS